MTQTANGEELRYSLEQRQHENLPDVQIHDRSSSPKDFTARASFLSEAVFADSREHGLDPDQAPTTVKRGRVIVGD